MPEARELNSFLLSVAAEVDSVVDPLLRELDQRADAVRVGQAAPDLPCSANGAPIEPPRNNRDWLLRFTPVWLSRIKELENKRNNGDPARHSSVNHRRAARPKDKMLILRILRSESQLTISIVERQRVHRQASTRPPRYHDDPYRFPA